MLTSSTVDEFELEIGLGSHRQDRRIYRLIIMRASEQTAQKRKRKLNANAKRRGYKLSEQSYLFAEWAILITNIDTVNLPAEMVWHLYSLRWQIELLFKQFKSILRIHKSISRTQAREHVSYVRYLELSLLQFIIPAFMGSLMQTYG